MKSGKRLANIIAATAFVVLSTGASLAASAHATANVNVRSGPGTDFHKVGQLHKGDNVDIAKCQHGWCQIAGGGHDGWVSEKYLNQKGGNAQTNASQAPTPGHQDAPQSGHQNKKPARP